MAGETAFLRARGLSCRRGGRTVLHGVDLDLPRGCVTALAGPSGAGKTTLLRCLVRLEEPTDGQVLVGGDDARELDPCLLRRRVGLVAQAPVMLPGDVAANVGYGLNGAGAEELARSLAAVGLSRDLLERDARELSGGEAARVALARALARAPAALLLDEPTAALDATAGRVVEEHVRSLAAGGLAILVVCHDRAQARRMAGRAVVLDGGRVVRAGGVEAVL
ncbi:MAG TPA: ATP-binding cassette domain-containing protein [Solirubrobacteraceae bacterium]|nr:ATP-binding cassette domain-containing protein [Solirubrobacteraceae bacterium]